MLVSGRLRTEIAPFRLAEVKVQGRIIYSKTISKEKREILNHMVISLNGYYHCFELCERKSTCWSDGRSVALVRWSVPL